MYVQQVLIMMLMTVICTLSRGPHHPRGDTVIKHHVHYKPTKNDEHHEKLTQDDQLLHDKEHIREELGQWVQDKDIYEMTNEELEFHYFNLHDSDRNSHLDGLEILQAMRHAVEHYDSEEDEEIFITENDFNYFVELIDEVLLEDDINTDGFLSYPEYVTAKRKDIESKAINELIFGPKIQS